jgi:hypothetical protein
MRFRFQERIVIILLRVCDGSNHKKETDVILKGLSKKKMLFTHNGWRLIWRM